MLSGKGGTGKTTVTAALAHLASQDVPIVLADADVDAANLELVLAPTKREERDFWSGKIAEIDPSACTACGRCAEVCQWHAIAVVGQRVLVFPQLCHGCGSCTLVCPEDAISEIPNPIGVLEFGFADKDMTFARGVLNVGEPMAVPIIRQLKKQLLGPSASQEEPRWVIIDASPGTTCPVVESMRGADFVLLVTEPTPFGLHDLRLAVQVAQELGIPCGVVINREGIGDVGVEAYCQENGIPVLMHIPLDHHIAEGIARGTPLVRIFPEYVERFQELSAQIVDIVGANQT